MLNNTRAYTGHISRAVRFRIECGNHDDDEDRGREPPEICHGKSPQPGWLRELSTHVSACCQCKHPLACHDDPSWGISPPECETKVVDGERLKCKLGKPAPIREPSLGLR